MKANAHSSLVPPGSWLAALLGASSLSSTAPCALTQTVRGHALSLDGEDDYVRPERSLLGARFCHLYPP